jgi:molybdopterin molybdotransferase
MEVALNGRGNIAPAPMPEVLLLKSADEARALLAGFAALPSEEVGFADADGRILAGAIVASEDLPPWSRSAMDGYAVRARDTSAVPVVLRLRGHVAMGELWRGSPPLPGDALGVPTGAAVPEGCDAVVMIEHTRPRSADEIEVRRTVAPGENLIRPGDDVHRGEILLPAGRRLRPVDLGALAAQGLVTVTVHRRPRVAILSTGNELVPPEQTPRPGQVRDVNAWILAAQAERLGCEVVHGGIVGDDAAALATRSAELVERADVLLLSGGSSIGTRDLTAAVLETLGAELLFHGVNVKPGRPTLLARLGEKPIFGMPGVPTSAAIIFDAFVRPLLYRLGGEPGADPWPCRRRARLARSVPSLPGREDYVRVRLTGDRAEPLAGGSSLASLVRADGLLVIPEWLGGLTEGAEVEIFLPA